MGKAIIVPWETRTLDFPWLIDIHIGSITYKEKFISDSLRNRNNELRTVRAIAIEAKGTTLIDSLMAESTSLSFRIASRFHVPPASLNVLPIALLPQSLNIPQGKIRGN